MFNYLLIVILLILSACGGMPVESREPAVSVAKPEPEPVALAAAAAEPEPEPVALAAAAAEPEPEPVALAAAAAEPEPEPVAVLRKANGKPKLIGVRDFLVRGDEVTQKQILAIEQEKVLQKQVLSAKHSKAAISKQISPEFSADAALLVSRDAYLKELKQASYTFNPPSPIKVATPVIVYFWLDPLAEPMRLAEELKEKLLVMVPGETPQTEAGRIDWSPNMRATLTGEDFDITPIEVENFDGLKNLSATRRTEWSWDVKAKHVGQQLPLHLRVWTILPKELGKPHEVLKLDKLIHVEVTFLWLVDEYWEKYWKWILGGLGTALAGAVGMWWKTRQTKVAGI